jgi:hypothetical protein
VGRAGADGPELVAGSDDARGNSGGRGCVLCLATNMVVYLR